MPQPEPAGIIIRMIPTVGSEFRKVLWDASWSLWRHFLEFSTWIQRDGHIYRSILGKTESRATRDQGTEKSGNLIQMTRREKEVPDSLLRSMLRLLHQGWVTPGAKADAPGFQCRVHQRTYCLIDRTCRANASDAPGIQARRAGDTYPPFTEHRAKVPGHQSRTPGWAGQTSA
ncbi:hypothetical protein C8R44DRAFT_745740 [Mycena epipterygia]|nr:hypothetical protein C8R44DRAFT_745740 [Mycena epipterygia]